VIENTQRRAIFDTLDAIISSTTCVAEIMVAKHVAALFDENRYAPAVPLRFVLEHAHEPAVLACLKLLAAIGEGGDAVEEWLDEHAPDGVKQHRNRELQALRVLHPEQWAERIISALRANDGNKEAAARDLKVARRTLFRWLKDPNVVARL